MDWFRKPAREAPPTLDAEKLPHHVAIIMDGNGRWAQKRHQPRAFGHRAGVEALRAIIRASSDMGIQALSLYALSTENWSRPAEEVGALMGLLMEFFTREIDELHANGVRITILGDVEGMPEPQRGALVAAMERTRENPGLRLNIALNYGGRAEIAGAARELARQVAAGTLDAADIDEARFAQSLTTAGLPEVDLLIRTSGEQRLSNFLLYQCAYAELLFVEDLWPDFDLNAYHRALLAYQQRTRRFGGL